jgi:hypothetical protein
MSTIATVRHVANGYIITSQGGQAVPATLFAATIPEVVFWLGKIFAPYA